MNLGSLRLSTRLLLAFGAIVTRPAFARAKPASAKPSMPARSDKAAAAATGTDDWDTF